MDLATYTDNVGESTHVTIPAIISHKFWFPAPQADHYDNASCVKKKKKKDLDLVQNHPRGRLQLVRTVHSVSSVQPWNNKV